jgi:hypothetical protein
MSTAAKLSLPPRVYRPNPDFARNELPRPAIAILREPTGFCRRGPLRDGRSLRRASSTATGGRSRSRGRAWCSFYRSLMRAGSRRGGAGERDEAGDRFGCGASCLSAIASHSAATANNMPTDPGSVSTSASRLEWFACCNRSAESEIKSPPKKKGAHCGRAP